MTQPPFEIKRMSLKSFWVTMLIIFQPWTKVSPLKIEHELRFGVGGADYNFDLDDEEELLSDRRELEKRLLKQLLEKMRTVMKDQEKKRHDANPSALTNQEKNEAR